jgi:uncharacterized repeat protein (TIGR03803 family)
MDASGNLYGTTFHGGNPGDGTVFKVSANGLLTTLATFQAGSGNGFEPKGGLLRDRSGNLYGTTYRGGPSDGGTVFELSPNGTLTTLATFNGSNGRFPVRSLTMDSRGDLLGTTAQGGSSDLGTVFKLSPNGTLTTLVNFTGSNGALPQCHLITDSSGDLYGTTQLGGRSHGTVFELSPNGTLTTLANFRGYNGDSPLAGLIMDSKGNFYGTTLSGRGSSELGTVFEVTPTGPATPEPRSLILWGEVAVALLGLACWRSRQRLWQSWRNLAWSGKMSAH